MGNKNETLSSRGAQATGDAVAACTKPVGDLASNILESAGQAVGQAVGGLVGGVADGANAARTAITGPDDPVEYDEWADRKAYKEAERARRKMERKIAKDTAPIRAMTAQIGAYRGLMEALASGPVSTEKVDG